ncbi:MAG TPA: hypothetical protein P5123_10185, partial [Spirochaetota bacterium]|nr:hypothetical protein [Spirochaetota bacterium]
MKMFFENSREIGKKDTVLVFTYEGFDFKTLPTKMEFMRTYGTALYFSELKNPLYLPSDKEADLIVVPLKNGDVIELETIRSASAQAARVAMQHKNSAIKIVLPEIDNISR